MLDIRKRILHHVTYIRMVAPWNVLSNLPYLRYGYRTVKLYIRLNLQPLSSLQLGHGGILH